MAPYLEIRNETVFFCGRDTRRLQESRAAAGLIFFLRGSQWVLSKEC